MATPVPITKDEKTKDKSSEEQAPLINEVIYLIQRRKFNRNSFNKNRMILFKMK